MPLSWFRIIAIVEAVSYLALLVAVIAKHINPYLVDGPDVVLPRRSTPLCDAPAIGIGHQPIDDGNSLFTAEDTAEIRCAAENAVALHTSDAVDMARLLKSTMRLRPDRIIVGEVRDGAALTPVSYTHLTLPTIYSVSISVAAVSLKKQTFC